MKQDIENIIKKILSENKGLPLDKLNGNLMERALGTMNYQLKQSLGREEIASVSNTNVLTEEDVGVINDIILTEKASLIADEVLKVVGEKIKEELENIPKVCCLEKIIEGACSCNNEGLPFYEVERIEQLLSNLSPNKENK